MFPYQLLWVSAWSSHYIRHPNHDKIVNKASDQNVHKNEIYLMNTIPTISLMFLRIRGSFWHFHKFNVLMMGQNFTWSRYHSVDITAMISLQYFQYAINIQTPKIDNNLETNPVWVSLMLLLADNGQLLKMKVDAACMSIFVHCKSHYRNVIWTREWVLKSACSGSKIQQECSTS